MYGRFPRPDSVEQAQLRDAPRRAEREALTVALAAHSGGTLTVEQATGRLRAGGQAYRDFLDAGQSVVLDPPLRRRCDPS